MALISAISRCHSAPQPSSPEITWWGGLVAYEEQEPHCQVRRSVKWEKKAGLVDNLSFFAYVLHMFLTPSMYMK